MLTFIPGWQPRLDTQKRLYGVWSVPVATRGPDHKGGRENGNSQRQVRRGKMGTMVRLAPGSSLWDRPLCLAAQSIKTSRPLRTAPFESRIYRLASRVSGQLWFAGRLKPIGDQFAPCCFGPSADFIFSFKAGSCVTVRGSSAIAGAAAVRGCCSGPTTASALCGRRRWVGSAMKSSILLRVRRFTHNAVMGFCIHKRYYPRTNLENLPSYQTWRDLR